MLVGGELTLEDGSVIDSRQPISNTSVARALLAAVAGSADWWLTASSVVVPTLADPAGGFALVLGPRTVVRVAPDGEVQRSALAKVIRATFGKLSIARSGINERISSDFRKVAALRNWSGVSMGEIGIRSDEAETKWRFLDGNEYYLGLVPQHTGARVVVDARGDYFAALLLPPAQDSLSIEYEPAPPSSATELVILPDTSEIRSRLEAALDGRRMPAPPEPPYVPGAPRDPAKYLKLPPLSARCRVTGLVRRGAWEDPAHLEAARRLLLERFDLRLGLWDLALNPVLRATALSAALTSAPPPEPVQAPVPTRRRAARRARQATETRNAGDHGAQAATQYMHEALRQLGWVMEERGRLHRPLTEPLTWDVPPAALVSLVFIANKNCMSVVVAHRFYNDLSVQDYITERKDRFAAIAPLPPIQRKSSGAASVQLWTATTGWGSSRETWAAAAEDLKARTPDWVELLADFADACRAVRENRIRCHQQRGGS